MLPVPDSGTVAADAYLADTVRLTTHPALDGLEIVHLRARLAHHRGDTGRAHALVQECLDALPGHSDFLDFAAEIGAPLPERARRAARFGM